MLRALNPPEEYHSAMRTQLYDFLDCHLSYAVSQAGLCRSEGEQIHYFVWIGQKNVTHCATPCSNVVSET